MNSVSHSSFRGRVALFGASHAQGFPFWFWGTLIVIPVLLSFVLGVALAVLFIIVGLIGLFYEPAAQLVEAAMSSRKDSTWLDLLSAICFGSIVFGIGVGIAGQLVMRLLCCLAPARWIAVPSLLSVFGRIAAPLLLLAIFWGRERTAPGWLALAVLVALLGLGAEWWLIRKLHRASFDLVGPVNSCQVGEPPVQSAEPIATSNAQVDSGAVATNQAPFAERARRLANEYWWLPLVPLFAIMTSQRPVDSALIARVFAGWLAICVVYLQLFRVGSWPVGMAVIDSGCDTRVHS